ncbi:MAG: uncharacterized protein JWN40_2324 [Phycisphaerales bacterium]|nr:uncharacterized protein [Phycisphaerales bacterium]
MPRSVARFALRVCFIFALAHPVFAQKTWSGAAADGGNWNGSGNWKPAGVPDLTSDAIFDATGAAVPTITILGNNASANSLAFNSGTINYNLISTAPILSGVTDITRGSALGGAAATINLASNPSGSLLFSNTGSLNLANNAPPTGATFPTLVIGPNTIIGTTGTGGVTVTGPGTTTISGSFATSSHSVIGGLTKTGTGILTLSGTNSGLSGPVTLGGGTLRLDYTSNVTGSKLGNGATSPAPSLALSSGNLVLQGNATTSILQSVNGTGGTAVNPGHSTILISTNNGALQPVTLDLKAIARPTIGATLDVDVSQVGAIVQTSNAVTAGILGSWFTANGGASWATKTGSSIVPLTALSTSFAAGLNTDVTPNTVAGAVTTNSLRFNNASPVTLTLVSTLVIQSGGILATPSSGGATITGGTINTNSPFEMTVHAYKPVVINSALQLTGGLTKTGPQNLSLGGSLAAMSGPININQGNLTFTNAAAFPANTSAVNLNDQSGVQQSLIFSLGVGTDLNAGNAIRLGANNVLSNQSSNSRIALTGLLSSPAGVVTPITIINVDDSSGFDFLNSANSFTGDVTLTRGSLGITSNQTLGDPSNRLLLSSGSLGGGLELLGNGADITHAVVMAADSRVLVNNAHINTISGQISGSGTLRKEGAGTLVLSGSNTDTGGLQIDAGAVRVSSAGNLGTAGGVQINAGTLAATSTFSLPGSRVFILGPATSDGTPTIDVAAGQTLNFGGVLISATLNGALLKTGPGALSLTNAAGNSSYSGGTTVQQGTLFANLDTSLGAAGAPVTVNALGLLAFTGSTTTARPFTLNNGTLSVTANRTLTLNGATVAGGFLSGPGTVALTGSATLGGVTATSSAVINQTGQAFLINFTNNGQYTNAAGQSVFWNGGANASAGRLIVNGAVNAVDFVSDGQINVASGAVLDNTPSTSSMVLGGGSRTTIETGGTLRAGSTTIEVNGGLLVNNGTVAGTTNVHFNGQAVGSGTYGSVNVFENGRFAPGASPSPAVFSPAAVAASQASFATGTSLAIEIGGKTAGSGFDQVNVAGAAALAGTLEVATANSFVPAALDAFKIVSFASRSGAFSTYAGTLTAANGLAYAPIYSDTDLTLVATLPGDANLDGKVDFLDLAKLAQSYNSTVSGITDSWWLKGDFNYDGKVDFLDLARLAQNYNTSAVPAAPGEFSAAFAADWTKAQELASVPEPSIIGVLGLCALAGRGRRRKPQ